MTRPGLFAAVFLTHLTAACATTPDAVIEYRTVTVEVPVAVTCVPEALPQPPAYRVTLGALRSAPDAASRLLLAVEGLLERDARLLETEPVLAGCRKLPEAPVR